MTAEPPLLWLLIGPNGAGKSTYYRTRIEPRLGVEFVNADVIAAAEWPDAGPEAAYEAGRRAAERRRLLIASRESFVTETVFSHPSKLDLVQASLDAGYELWVTFVCVQTPELAVARVAHRVRRGGHDVPRDKIEQRFARMTEQAKIAVRRARRAFIVDNSDPRRPLRDVMTFERGQLTWRADDLPAWCCALFGGALD